MKTISAFFSEPAQAKELVKDLVDHGFAASDIGFVAGSSARNEHMGANSSLGAEAGAVIGGAVGLLIGATALTIPGVGPVIASGSWVSALTGAGIGAATGGVAGALSNDDLPREELAPHLEGLEKRGALVTLHVPDDRETEAETLFSSHSSSVPFES